MYKPNEQPHNRRGGHKITTPEGVQCRSHSKQSGSEPAIDHRTCMGKGKTISSKHGKKQGPPRHQGRYNLSTKNPQDHAQWAVTSSCARSLKTQEGKNTHVYTTNKPAMRWMPWANNNKTPKGQMQQCRTQPHKRSKQTAETCKTCVRSQTMGTEKQTQQQKNNHKKQWQQEKATKQSQTPDGPLSYKQLSKWKGPHQMAISPVAVGQTSDSDGWASGVWH